MPARKGARKNIFTLTGLHTIQQRTQTQKTRRPVMSLVRIAGIEAPVVLPVPGDGKCALCHQNLPDAVRRKRVKRGRLPIPLRQMTKEQRRDYEREMRQKRKLKESALLEITLDKIRSTVAIRAPGP